MGKRKFCRPLPAIKVSRELFDDIMSHCQIEFVDDIGLYRNGYEGKDVCKAIRDKYVICTGMYINLLLDKEYRETGKVKIRNNELVDWKQYVCTLVEDLEVAYTGDFAPYICVKLVNDQLHYEGLNDDDIEERLCSYQEEKDDTLRQVHIENVEKGKVLRFDNCVYYDINKAHSYALGIIFPEIKPWLEKIAAKAKKDKKWKSVANYYVGMLAFKTESMKRKGLEGKHEKTYNWIVHNTTRTLLKRIDECSSYDRYGMMTNTIVYANTDGVVIQNPTKFIESSSKFGEFKVESDETTFYTYAGENYFVIQYGDTIKGNLPVKLRKYVDLRKGKVITYTRKKVGNVFEYNDIVEKTIDIEVI